MSRSTITSLPAPGVVVGEALVSPAVASLRLWVNVMSRCALRHSNDVEVTVGKKELWYQITYI